MTQEEKDRMSNQRGLIVPPKMSLDRVQGDGRQGVPVFPSDFSNIGPSEQKAGQTRFAGGMPATMGVGGMNSAYPPSLGLSGGAFGSREMGSRDFGSLGLPQAQAFGFGQSASFTGGGELRSEGYNFRQPLDNLALPQQTSIPVGGGPVAMGYNQAGKTQEQQGKIEIKTPRGSMWATQEQTANMMTPRTAGQQNSRSPAEQQALIDNIRKNAPALNQQRTDWVQNTIQQRRENPTTYTTPSGKSVAVPTNRFGEPLKAWMDQLGDSGRLNYGPRPAPQTASAASSRPAVQDGGLNSGILASTGFGAMQREQNEMMPPPIRSQSLFGNMGYASTFGGGPQPASPMLTGNSMVGRTRKRLFGTV
jgi:hypothetical protein